MIRLYRAARFLLTPIPDPVHTVFVMAGLGVLMVGLGCIAVWWPL